MSELPVAKRCVELLENYEYGNKAFNPKKLEFTGVEGMDVYNITAPFKDDGNIVIAGRVEHRNSEIACVRFFIKQPDNTWKADYPEKVFYRFQDPFFTKINNELIFGGVQISTNPLYSEEIISWKTLFYRGKTIQDLKLFASGPDKMKDIRIVELQNGGVGVFTRPQGGDSGMGKIGYISVDKLEDITPEIINQAHVFDSHFIPGEWGGVNEPCLLKNGKIGILGHIAYWENRAIRHYHAMSFVFDPINLTHTPVKIIATRKDFPEGHKKRADLEDVLFSGGLVRNLTGKSILYTGLSDAEAYSIEIDDPFSNDK